MKKFLGGEKESEMKNETTKQETWKPIDGYDGEYEVSNLGRVRSLKSGQPTLRKLAVNPITGYIQVSLRKNGASFSHYVHRLVAGAFIPNPNNLELVDHIDNDR